MLNSIYNLYNRYTLRRISNGFKPFTEVKSGFKSPLLISGAFRSGTSIITRLLCNAGYSCGPESHLLQPKGRYKEFNPDGYFENYFFMELSRYLFHLTDSAGDRPPSASAVKTILQTGMNDADFRAYAILKLRESRVSNRNKERVLKCASVNNCAAYVSNVFGNNPVIKNPHFGVLLPWIEKEFPESTHVVVFRNPDDWLRSAKVVTPNATYSLYNKYYESHLDSSRISNRVFVNYDELINAPESSIKNILLKLGLINYNEESLVRMIRRKPAKPIDTGVGETELYQQLKQLSVNG
jgi:hypothetical protein